MSKLWDTHIISAAEFPDDVAREIAAKEPALVLIMSMQIQGGRQLLYWCKALRAAQYKGTITVLLPAKLRDYDTAFKRLRKAGATFVMTSVGQAIRRMQLQAKSLSNHD